MSEFVTLDAWARVGMAMGWTTLVGLAVGVGLRLPAGRLVDRAAFATVSGIGVLVLVFAAAEALGVSFTAALRLGHVLAGAGGIAAVVIVLRTRRLPSLRVDRTGTVALVVAVAVTAHWLHTMGPLSSGSDALDHLGTIRAIESRGELEPNTVFYAEGDGATPDVRKGFLHAWMAAVARVSGLDPVPMWYALTAWLAALSVIAFLPLARVLLPSSLAAHIALVVYPFLVHGNAHWFLDTIAYPHNADWAAIWLVLALVVGRVVDPDAAPARWWIAPLVVPLAGWHVFAPLLLLSALVTLPAGYAIVRDRAATLAVAKDTGIVALLAAPLLAWRLARTYLPINPLHTEVNEVFFISKWLTLHSLDSTFRKFPLEVLALVVLSVFVLRKTLTGERAIDRRRVALLALSWCPMLVSFNPVAGRILQPKMGYMFERFLGIIPFPALAAALVTNVSTRVWLRWGTRAAVVAALCVVVPRWWAEAAPAVRHRELLTSPERWREGMSLIETQTPEGATIATDAVTGYAIPAYTGRRVIAVLDQHSSPSDSTILGRLEDVVRILNPYRPLDETLDRLHARGATYVFVNEAFGAQRRSHFDARGPGPRPGERARFAASEYFRELASGGGCTLFEVVPGRSALPAAHSYPGLVTGSAACAEATDLNDRFTLCRAEIAPAVAAPGDTVSFVLVVKKTQDDPIATPYRWTVRGRRQLDPDEAQFEPVERWYSRFISPARGARREFVVVRRPTNGRYPPRLWEPGDVVADTLWTRLPVDLEPGIYEIGARMGAQTFARNVALADLLSPRRSVGVPAGRLEVRAR